MDWISFIFALVAGAAITLQAGSNSQLKESLHTPIGALVTNYVIGCAALVLYAVLARLPILSINKMTDVPWWAWSGGVLGMLYGLAVVILAHRMGAATLIATVVTGQLICSVVVDHFAWVGFELHRASLLRIAGCALMVVGLILVAQF